MIEAENVILEPKNAFFTKKEKNLISEDRILKRKEMPQRLRVLFSGMKEESIEIVRASPLFKICEKSLKSE